MPGHFSPAALRFTQRVEAKGARIGLIYPWWIAIFSTVGQVACAVLATAQRDAFVPPQWIALSGLLVAAPYLVQYVVERWIMWWLDSIVVIGAVIWLLTIPVPSTEPMDMAPVILCILVADVACTGGPKPAMAVAAVSIVIVAIAIDTDPNGLFPLYVGEILFGLIIGFMLRSQMRALAAEQKARQEDQARVAMAERQRIAREIHDLVAHSLSVTMLHVTGARRALTEDADIEDAIEALRDAERIGREAMSDIRRTVGLLGAETAGVKPLPVAADLPQLVADARSAGVDVTFHVEGAVAELPDTAGLAIYRVVQESLANAVKHAPGAPVSVRLIVADDGVRLTVRNPIPVGAVVQSGGSGIGGMTARAHQLGGTVVAGPGVPDREDDWVVDLQIPLGGPEVKPSGLLDFCVVRKILS